MISCENLAAAGELFGESGNDNTLSSLIDLATYQLGLITPGTYIVTIEGKADKSSPTQSWESTFTFTLVDPCDPPTSITAAVLTDQVYTITDEGAKYTHPDFVISPEYCPFMYSYAISEITNVAGESAITRADKTFLFSYSQSLLPVGNSQTVTVTATSSSIYSAAPSVLVDSSSFDLTILNPCIDPAFVTIEADVLLN
jgi:hypothetical protein